MAYNKFINKFDTLTEYDTYINGSIAEAPNLAYVVEDGSTKYTKVLPNNYLLYGTTTGTTDFMLGSSGTSSWGSADCIQIHVSVEDDSGVNKIYVAEEDILKTAKTFYTSYSGLGTTEGLKVITINKCKINTSAATRMDNMFDGCSSLTLLDLSSFDTSSLTDMNNMFGGCSSLTSLYLSSNFFNSTSLTTYDFSGATVWTDTSSLTQFVTAITAHDGTSKTVQLSTNTKAALTTEQTAAITDVGWTIA